MTLPLGNNSLPPNVKPITVARKWAMAVWTGASTVSTNVSQQAISALEWTEQLPRENFSLEKAIEFINSLLRTLRSTQAQLEAQKAENILLVQQIEAIWELNTSIIVELKEFQKNNSLSEQRINSLEAKNSKFQETINNLVRKNYDLEEKLRMSKLHERVYEDQISGLSKALQEKEWELQEALIDELTGLFSRRKVDSTFYETIGRHPDAPFQVLFLDIDRFKDVNDTYGHKAGDSVLKITTDRLRTTCDQLCKNYNIPKDEVIYGRYGWEEFIVIFTGKTAIQHSLVFSQKLRGEFKIEENDSINPITKNVTASAWLSPVKYLSDSSFGLAIAEADRALYNAKHYGRNRLMQYSDDLLTTEELKKIREEADKKRQEAKEKAVWTPDLRNNRWH